jgi:hypothetical protein
MSIPPRLQALFEVAGREPTAELFKIAQRIHEGCAAEAILDAPPAWLREIFRDLDADALDRVGLFVSWAMHVQRTTTVRELVRERKIERTVAQFRAREEHSGDDFSDCAYG